MIATKSYLSQMFRDMAAISKQNHEAYATHHGYGSITITRELRSHDRPRVWDKIATCQQALEEAMADQRLDSSSSSSNSGGSSGHGGSSGRGGSSSGSAEHWVWALDGDAFIMDFNRRLDRVINEAKRLHVARVSPGAGPGPELALIYTADCNGLNGGSFLVRASHGGRRVLQEIWDAYDSANTTARLLIHERGYNKQGAMQWLLGGGWPALAQLSQAVDMRLMNSYYASPCGHNYVPGDFVLHLVNWQKLSFPAVRCSVPVLAGGAPLRRCRSPSLLEYQWRWWGWWAVCVMLSVAACLFSVNELLGGRLVTLAKRLVKITGKAGNGSSLMNCCTAGVCICALAIGVLFYSFLVISTRFWYGTCLHLGS